MTSQATGPTVFRINPFPKLLHDMDYLSQGYKLSIPLGHYEFLTSGYVINGVQTVFETRRQRLKMLVNSHGSVADLNRALGWEETNARLYQIHNRSMRKDRGTPYEMGDQTAREIEAKLSLAEGWMDTPPTYSELLGEEDPMTKAIMALEQLDKEQIPVATRLISAFAQPEKKLSNGG